MMFIKVLIRFDYINPKRILKHMMFIKVLRGSIGQAAVPSRGPHRLHQCMREGLCMANIAADGR